MTRVAPLLIALCLAVPLAAADDNSAKASKAEMHGDFQMTGHLAYARAVNDASPDETTGIAMSLTAGSIAYHADVNKDSVVVANSLAGYPRANQPNGVKTEEWTSTTLTSLDLLQESGGSEVYLVPAANAVATSHLRCGSLAPSDGAPEQPQNHVLGTAGPVLALPAGTQIGLDGCHQSWTVRGDADLQVWGWGLHFGFSNGTIKDIITGTQVSQGVSGAAQLETVREAILHLKNATIAFNMPDQQTWHMVFSDLSMRGKGDATLVEASGSIAGTVVSGTTSVQLPEGDFRMSPAGDAVRIESTDGNGAAPSSILGSSMQPILAWGLLGAAVAVVGIAFAARRRRSGKAAA